METIGTQTGNDDVGCPEVGCQESWDPTGGPDSAWGRVTGEIEKELSRSGDKGTQRGSRNQPGRQSMWKESGDNTEES